MSSQSTGAKTVDRVADVRGRLAAHDQEHVLQFWDELSADAQESLLAQIEAIDLEHLDTLIGTYVRAESSVATPGDLEPAPYYANDSGGSYDPDAYCQTGDELLRAGTVAAFTVAGGQGTRLGWNGPKGTFPGTPVTGKPLFRCFAEQILAAQQRYDVKIPWYLMTSPLNDADTRAFFQDNNYFGLNRTNIFTFPQGTMPSLSLPDGKLLLAGRGELAVNPDGHGGSIKALHASGALEDMTARGIQYISYFQVDNPLVHVIDPLFLGLHASAPDSSGEVSSKMVAKTDPTEKVGVFCQSAGRTTVFEYSDLPDDLAQQKKPNGELRFNAGSIAIHLLSVKFVQQLTSDSGTFGLPLHRAVKKVPYIDPATGTRVEPTEPNAVKLETFVFDAVPLAESSIVLETRREEEFAPIKNATGSDSPATSFQLQSNYYGRWLEQAGVHVARTESGDVAARIEISPLTADRPLALENADLPEQVGPGDNIAI